ncbi:MAG: substrate-binding domain-containing protein [Oscillospiraceae bacterium]|nr:substrate-binding domain-containing protein [Oscillospiraceae bacterium]
MKRTKLTALLLAALMVVGLFAACGNGNGGDTDAGDRFGDIFVEAGPVLARGPHGEEAFPADQLSLSDEDVERIRAGGYTAAICFHYAGSDWSRAQQMGLEYKFGYLGIEIVAITNADFSAEQQVTDIETVLALNPDIIVSIPVDPVATANAFQRAADQGVHIVFMDNVPDGMTAGVDYVSVVSADNAGNGVVAARIMGQALGGEGRIGVIYHDANFFVTNQRVAAFEETIRDEFPNIEIVDRGGFDDPNRVNEVADAMLTRVPDIDGIFANWDTPAEAVVASAIAAGRNDLVITTVDLGDNVARMIAERQMVAGLGAQLPFHQGVAEAILAAYALLGREAPAYVAVPAQPVFFANLLEAYELVYNTPAPAWLRELHEANR